MFNNHGRSPYLVSYIPKKHKFEELTSVVPFKDIFSISSKAIVRGLCDTQDSISQSCCSSGRQAMLPSVVGSFMHSHTLGGYQLCEATEL